MGIVCEVSKAINADNHIKPYGFIDPRHQSRMTLLFCSLALRHQCDYKRSEVHLLEVSLNLFV